MTKKQIKYWCRMVIKTIILLLPLITLIMSLVASNTYGVFKNSFDLTTFKGLTINSWYTQLINAIGVGGMVSSEAWVPVLYYPLYVIWVEIFDLVVHFFLFIPNLCHKWMGDND